VQGCKNLCADTLSRSFVDMSDTDKKEFLPTAAEQSEDFILPVRVTSSDEQHPEDISFIDASDGDDGDLTYCMLICDTSCDSEDVTTSMRSPGCETLSGSNVVTRKQSYGPDSQISPPVQSESSGVPNDELPLSTEESETDTAEVTGDMKLESDNPDVPLNFLPKPSQQDYDEDEDFGSIYRFILEDKFQGSEKDYHRLLLTKDQYFIQNGLLYKLVMPRKAKLQRAYPISEHPCLPQKNSEVYCYSSTTTNWDTLQ